MDLPADTLTYKLQKGCRSALINLINQLGKFTRNWGKSNR